MMTADNFSVIMPVYNGEKYIREAIESVLSQSLPGKAELIVIDDGSTDDSLSIAKSMGAVTLSQEHKHAAAARNLGIRNASREWIFFLDADDVLKEDAFSGYAGILSENSDTTGVLSKIMDFISPELTDDQKSLLIARNEPYSGPIAGATLIKKDVFETVGLFNESLSSGEGIDWLMRYRSSGLKYINADFVSAGRRLHMTNTGRVSKADERKNIAAILRQMRKNAK